MRTRFPSVLAIAVAAVLISPRVPAREPERTKAERVAARAPLDKVPNTWKELHPILVSVREGIIEDMDGSTYCTPAFKLMSKVSNRDLIPKIGEHMLSTDSWGVKLACFYALHNMPSDATRDALVRTVASALPAYSAKKGRLDPVDDKLGFLSTPDWWMRKGFLERAASHLADKPSPEAVAAFKKLWAIEQLHYFGKPGLEAILDLSKQTDLMNMQFMRAVWACKRDDCHELLRTVARERIWPADIRAGAARALERWDRKDLATLNSIVKTAMDHTVLNAALLTLDKVDKKAERRAALARLKTESTAPNYLLRVQLFKALGRAGTKEDLPLLEAALEHRQDAVKFEVVRSIWQITGTTPAVKWISPLYRMRYEAWLKSRKK